ncbi:MAG: aminotransferase class I/II-fold pyridoxal phosphate-dependent enzyme [Phycisphaeraceae bacterium]|nr:aminotransferase class I/II-fold pyridoxal phosphate-dependent enzyme [Phycisphaeraceae bacterium]
MHSIDLRSDTVTRPTPAMWGAMRHAELGDDVLGDEPTVAALESKVAALLGHEAALFTPSGTMANQLAIRCACEPGDEIIAHRESHIIHYETAAPAALSGCMILGLDGPGGRFDADSLRAAIRGGDIHSPKSRMVVAENTHNRGGGTVWSLEEFKAVAREAREASLHLHVDGARLANAAVAAGYSMRDFASEARSVSLCFSKGLGCPVGSALAGPRDWIERARRFRKMFGGGMRQSGLLAAAAIWALDHHIDRLASDHANARRLAEGLREVDGLALEIEPKAIPTNMVFFRVDPRIGTARDAAFRLAERGVRLIPMGPQRLRAVTHLDVSESDIDRAIEIIREALRAVPQAAARAGHQ